MIRILWLASLWSCSLMRAPGQPEPPEPSEPSEPSEPPAPDAAPAAPQVQPQPPPPEPLPLDGAFSRELAPGLTVAAYLPPEIPDPGFSRPPAEEVADTDPRLYVVTLDPAHYELVYLSTLDPAVEGTMRTASQWLADEGLSVAFNPGMFEPDRSATGYTRSGAFVSQAQVRRQGLYRSWFVAGPGGEGPQVAVLDQIPPRASGNYVALQALPQDFRDTLQGYQLVSQSLAILRDGRAAYPARKNQWSELAYGVDRQGRVVIVFSRYPYEMRELGARIEALGLGIEALIHGEGGPEASLSVREGGVELVAFGSYETGFFGDDNTQQWSLPAVLGARRRATPAPQASPPDARERAPGAPQER